MNFLTRFGLTSYLYLSSSMFGNKQDLVDVFCHGPLLSAVQEAHIFADSKEFVDRPLKSSKAKVLRAFTRLKDSSKTTLKAFVEEYFDPVGSDLQLAVLQDYHPEPLTLTKIPYKHYKDWALALHKLWPTLARLPTAKSAHSTLLPFEHPIIIPGGRFRESYYWDTYWILHGLLASEMEQMALGIVQNFFRMLQEYGKIPNGGRLYYLDRSQPPMLSEMVKLLCTRPSLCSLSFLKDAVEALDKEYQFWMMTVDENGLPGHAIKVKDPNSRRTFVLNRYISQNLSPRPESYTEDVETAKSQQQRDEKVVYQELRAAAESGWDFSSRWLNAKTPTNLASIATSHVIPVELNSMMHRMEKNLASFHETLGNQAKVQYYQQQAATRQEAIEAILWDSKTSMWRDYNVMEKKQSAIMTISNFIPLWSHSFDEEGHPERIASIVKALKSSGLIKAAGIETTTINTGQQWDEPNAWPPLQDLIVEGLLSYSQSSEAQALAKHLLNKWLKTNYQSYRLTGHMYEKYDATKPGTGGHGGEYEVQVGFGWTNGVVLKFLTQYSDLLEEN